MYVSTIHVMNKDDYLGFIRLETVADLIFFLGVVRWVWETEVPSGVQGKSPDIEGLRDEVPHKLN